MWKTIAVLLALGAVLAWQVDAALGIRFRPADVPVEHPVAAPARPVAAAPALADLAVPDDRRVRLAAEAVASALVERGAPRPAIRTGGTGALRVATSPELSGEAFRMRHDGGLVVEAGTPAGAAAGLYTIADRIRSGDDLVPPGDEGQRAAGHVGTLWRS